MFPSVALGASPSHPVSLPERGVLTPDIPVAVWLSIGGECRGADSGSSMNFVGKALGCLLWPRAFALIDPLA